MIYEYDFFSYFFVVKSYYSYLKFTCPFLLQLPVPLYKRINLDWLFYGFSIGCGVMSENFCGYYYWLVVKWGFCGEKSFNVDRG